MILIFSFTLLIGFIVYKLTGKEKYMVTEKPLWKKLIYWGIILFISIIFNVVMYSDSKDTYRLSGYINNDNFELIIFFAFCCLAVQLLSPSLFGREISRLVKVIVRKDRHKDTSEAAFADEKNISYSEPSQGRMPNIYSMDKIKAISENFKDQQEKDFEIFLNTLCWLAFTFVIVISILFEIIGYGTASNVLSMPGAEYETIREQLENIGSVMLIFTLSIALRQILFYLGRIRKSQSLPDKNLTLNSLRYQKYLLLQKRLGKANKRL